MKINSNDNNNSNVNSNDNNADEVKILTRRKKIILHQNKHMKKSCNTHIAFLC